MPALPRAVGEPDCDALAIIEMIRCYVARLPSSDVGDNVERLRGLHHVFDAARDGLDVGMALINSAVDGRVSYRRIEAGTGINKDSAVAHVRNGKRLLGGVA